VKHAAKHQGEISPWVTGDVTPHLETVIWLPGVQVQHTFDFLENFFSHTRWSSSRSAKVLP
jgi:hypothetical protein